MWPDRRILDLLGIELPIIQAPMAGPVSSAMVITVSEVGGLGSLPCATLSAEQARDELGVVRQGDRRMEIYPELSYPTLPLDARL